MRKEKGSGKAFRRIAIALACIMALCAFAPSGIAAKANAAEAVNAVTLGASSFSYVVGQTGKLHVKGQTGLIYKSSNPKVFKVVNKKTGQYRAMKAGKAVFSVWQNGKKKLTANITVKRNIRKFKLSKGGRNTGFYDISQSNGLMAGISVKPVSLEFLANGSLKATFQLYNFSDYYWKEIKRIRDVVIIDKSSGKVLVDKDPVTLKKPIRLKPGKKLNWTVTFPKSQVKNFINLREISGIRWGLDIYKNYTWRDMY